MLGNIFSLSQKYFQMRAHVFETKQSTDWMYCEWSGTAAISPSAPDPLQVSHFLRDPEFLTQSNTFGLMHGT